jgi:Predicted ATPase
MKAIDSKHFVINIILDRDKIASFKEYPFNLPAIKDLKELPLGPEVTFLVGENGSGKSTLLEAIAIAYGFNAEGGSKNFSFSTHESHSKLNLFIKLQKGIRKPKDGFFLRAESFYNVASNIDDMDSIPSSSAPIIQSYGGISLHEQSHGESFMALLLNRFGDNGLYILDEPEAALSPTRQMALLTRMHELIKKGSQFIIATHSPIIMSYPGATIYQIDERGINKTAYEETEHFIINRQFANNYKGMLKMLLD